MIADERKEASVNVHYYDVTLGVDIPHGSRIVDQTCRVEFTYENGSRSYVYSGTVLVWHQQNWILMTSPVSTILLAWVGATGGTLTIDTEPRQQYPIIGFAKN